MKVSLSLAFVELLDGVGFALLGEFLLAVAPKGTKKSCPCIRPRLRRGALAPSLLRGPAYKGHPWPFTPLAASMPLAPLHSDSTRPPERGGWWRLLVRTKKAKPKQHQQSSKRLGPRSPSGGRVEVLRRGTRGMDAERGTKGQGRPFVTAPGATPERGKSGRRPDPDVGVAFSLVTFSWPDKSNEAKRSNSRRLARRASVASQVTRPGAETSGISTLGNRPDLQATSLSKQATHPILPIRCQTPWNIKSP